VHFRAKRKRAGASGKTTKEVLKMRSVIQHEVHGVQVIQGVLLKCVDGRWEDRDGLTPPDPLLAVGMLKCLQCWRDGQPQPGTIIERPDAPLPDVNELNSQIPKKQWEKGLDGEPRPPWQKQYVVYLINPDTGDLWTFINSTTGARIAYDRLQDKFKWMSALRGHNVVPAVKLDSRPMKTKFGQKMRPEFTVIEWRELSPEAGTVPQIEHHKIDQVPEPQPEQKLEQKAEHIEQKTKPAPEKKVTIGKKTKEPTLKEELKDEVRF
jgi:hypothetical protein